MQPTRRQRGRKGAAALATAAAFGLTMPRIPPPVELSGEECEIFHMITEGMPADWFGSASLPLLMQLCRHSIQARRVAELVEKAAGDRETTLGFTSTCFDYSAPKAR